MIGSIMASAAGVAVLAYICLEYTSVFRGIAVRINNLVLVLALTILLESLIWMLASSLSISIKILVSLLLIGLLIISFTPFRNELTNSFWNRHYYGVHMLVGIFPYLHVRLIIALLKREYLHNRID